MRTELYTYRGILVNYSYIYLFSIEFLSVCFLNFLVKLNERFCHEDRFHGNGHQLYVLFWLGGKRGVRGPGVRGLGVRGPGVWKTRGVENTGSGGKHGVWRKTRGLSGKHGDSVQKKGEPLFRPTMKSKFCYFKLQ